MKGKIEAVANIRKGATSAKTARLFTSGSLPSSKEGQTPRLWRSFPTPPMR